MAEAKTDVKKKKNGFFKGVRHEWRKISWTSREDLTKQTTLVVIMSVFLGILISAIDGGALRLIEWILSI